MTRTRRSGTRGATARKRKSETSPGDTPAKTMTDTDSANQSDAWGPLAGIYTGRRNAATITRCRNGRNGRISGGRLRAVRDLRVRSLSTSVFHFCSDRRDTFARLRFRPVALDVSSQSSANRSNIASATRRSE